MLTLNPFLFFLFFFCNFYFFSLFLAFGFFFFPSPCGLSLAATFVFDLDSSLFCLIVFLSPKVFLAFAFVFVCHRGSFWPIGADLFQLLRDSCCNKQPSRLSRFFFFFFPYVVDDSSVHLHPHFAPVTDTSSLHLPVFIYFYCFLQSDLSMVIMVFDFCSIMKHVERKTFLDYVKVVVSK